MRYAASFLVLGCAAAQQQYGQNPQNPPGESPTGSMITVTFMSEVYTIPVFDLAKAATYGSPETTIYRPTDLTISTKQPASSTASSSHVKACKVPAPTTLSTSRKTAYHTAGV